MYLEILARSSDTRRSSFADPLDSAAARLVTGTLGVTKFQFMATPTSKDKVLDAIQKLPPDATVEDALERIYFLYKVERGLAEAQAGQTVPHEEVKARFRR